MYQRPCIKTERQLGYNPMSSVVFLTWHSYKDISNASYRCQM